MQEKTDRMLEYFNKRDVERRLDYQTKLDDRELANAENEKVEFFEHSFNEKRQEILDCINDSKEINIKALAEHFNHISNQILILQKYVAASNIFLRTYDIKRYQQSIQELTNQVRDIESELLPKKKFGFKKKKDVKLKDVSVVDSSTNGKLPHKIVLDENFSGFKNENGRTLSLYGQDIHKKNVTLSNLTNCVVRLFGNASTVHMSNLNNCKIFSGPVSTSIFADYCIDCTFVISCQQLRLHSSHNVYIYLHVTSRAIMEECDNVSMAPYNLDYNNIDKDFEMSGLDRKLNHWNSVDDFNWLNAEKKSPHWKILDENRWISDWSEFIS